MIGLIVLVRLPHPFRKRDMTHILLIDNYDSFTYNLYHYLIEVGATVDVFRHDAIQIQDIQAGHWNGIVLSPGPCTPNEAGICLDVVTELHTTFPILGVCLGHQAIGQAFGAKIVRGDKPMHAKISDISHQGGALFNDISSPFSATRYHSLVIHPDTLPNCLQVIAQSDDSVIQAIAHQEYPVYGVQFHPESIASESGHQLLQNFVTICQDRL